MKPAVMANSLVRFAAILVLVGLLDGVVVWVVPHPRPWVVTPALLLIPLLTAAFVIRPLAKASESPAAEAPPRKSAE
jgi:hypothetical protein